MSRDNMIEKLLQSDEEFFRDDIQDAVAEFRAVMVGERKRYRDMTDEELNRGLVELDLEAPEIADTIEVAVIGDRSLLAEDCYYSRVVLGYLRLLKKKVREVVAQETAPEGLDVDIRVVE